MLTDYIVTLTYNFGSGRDFTAVQIVKYCKDEIEAGIRASGRLKDKIGSGAHINYQIIFPIEK